MIGLQCCPETGFKSLKENMQWNVSERLVWLLNILNLYH